MPNDRTSPSPSPAEELRSLYGAPALPESVRCGLASVDEEHAVCEAQQERVADAVRAGAPAAEVKRALRSWRRLTAAHFRSEEALMREVGFPDLAEHRAAHARFLDDLDLALAELSRGAVPPRVAAFVLEDGPRWVDAHYASDRALPRHLDASGRDPAGAARAWRAGVPDLEAAPGMEDELILIDDADVLAAGEAAAELEVDVEVELEPEFAGAIIEVEAPTAAEAPPLPEVPAAVAELAAPPLVDALAAIATGDTEASSAQAAPAARGPSPAELAAARAALRESASALALALRHGEVARARELADAVVAAVQALFDDEERLMREEGYEAAAPHLVAHALFLSDLGRLRADLSGDASRAAARWGGGRTASWLAAHHALADVALDGFLTSAALARA